MLLSFVLYPPFYRAFKKTTVKVFSYPLRTVASVKENLRSKQDVIEENLALLERVGSLELELQRLSGLENENQRLRKLVDLSDAIDTGTVACRIIARNPGRWRLSFIVDKGFDHGIAEDAAVISPEGLAGKITEVSGSFSTVIPVFHPAFTAGGVLESSGIHGIVSGTIESEVIMRYIPLEAEVPQGEVVRTSRYSAFFPEGIKIGRVARIGKSEDGLSQTAVVDPSVDIYRQDLLLCVIEE